MPYIWCIVVPIWVRRRWLNHFIAYNWAARLRLIQTSTLENSRQWYADFLVHLYRKKQHKNRFKLFSFKCGRHIDVFNSRNTQFIGKSNTKMSAVWRKTFTLSYICSLRWLWFWFRFVEKLEGTTCTANKCIMINTDVTAINRYHQFTSSDNWKRNFVCHFLHQAKKKKLYGINEMCRTKAYFNRTLRNEMECPGAAHVFPIANFIISIALQNYTFIESKFILNCTYYLLVRRRNIKTNRKQRNGWHGRLWIIRFTWFFDLDYVISGA